MVSVGSDVESKVILLILGFSIWLVSLVGDCIGESEGVAAGTADVVPDLLFVKLDLLPWKSFSFESFLNALRTVLIRLNLKLVVFDKLCVLDVFADDKIGEFNADDELS